MQKKTSLMLLTHLYLEVSFALVPCLREPPFLYHRGVQYQWSLLWYRRSWCLQLYWENFPWTQRNNSGRGSSRCCWCWCLMLGREESMADIWIAWLTHSSSHHRLTRCHHRPLNISWHITDALQRSMQCPSKSNNGSWSTCHPLCLEGPLENVFSENWWKCIIDKCIVKKSVF